MSQPIHYVKDSQLFPVVIEDFSSMTDEGLDTRPLGHAGGQYWHVHILKNFHEGVPILWLLFQYDDRNRNITFLDTHLAFYIDNQDPASSYFTQTRENLERGQRFETVLYLDEFLEENSGFLENDVMKIQVEIRVDAIIDKDGIRKFNFHDPFEGCVTLTNPMWPQNLYVGKSLISFHCPMIANEISNGWSEIEVPTNLNRDSFETFLQLLHGVRLKPSAVCKLPDLIRAADPLQINNILQYFSSEFIKFSWRWYVPIHLLPTSLAIKVMRCADEEEDFRDFMELIIDELEMLENGLMKGIVEKFFSFVVDNDDNLIN